MVTAYSHSQAGAFVTTSSIYLTVNGVDKIGAIREGSLKLTTTADGAQGVLDVTFLDFRPSDNDQIILAQGSTRYYSGYVRAIETVELRPGHYISNVSCQDDAATMGEPTAAPYGLSDNPNYTTTFPYVSLQYKQISARGDSYVGLETGGTISTYKAGFSPGMLLPITSANNGLSATEFVIVEVSTEWENRNTPIYTINFGDSPIRLVDAIESQIDASVESAALELAQQLHAPHVVTVLPTLPDPDYPEGELAYLTTDGKIYRVISGDLWSAQVDGADILVSSITAGAIQAGAIGAEALAAEIVLATTFKTADDPDRVEIDTAGIRAYAQDVLTAELAPEGISAESIRIGTLAGGHNLIKNSSFELAAFITAATIVTFTNNSGTPGWKAANRTTALDNISENTNDLTATTVAY